MRQIIASMLVLVSLTSVAAARTMRATHVTRVATGLYQTDDGQLVKAKGCTDSADHKPAIVDDNGIESVLVFLDDSGEVEDTCGVQPEHRSVKTASTPRKTPGKPATVATR
jgi:hypothetical protein